MNRLIKFCFISFLAFAFNAHSEDMQGAQYKELGPLASALHCFSIYLYSAANS